MSGYFENIPDDAFMGFPDKETMIRAAKVLRQANVPFHIGWHSGLQPFPTNGKTPGYAYCEIDEVVFGSGDQQESPLSKDKEAKDQ